MDAEHRRVEVTAERLADGRVLVRCEGSPGAPGWEETMDQWRAGLLLREVEGGHGDGSWTLGGGFHLNQEGAAGVERALRQLLRLRSAVRAALPYGEGDSLSVEVERGDPAMRAKFLVGPGDRPAFVAALFHAAHEVADSAWPPDQNRLYGWFRTGPKEGAYLSRQEARDVLDAVEALGAPNATAKERRGG
jgi:hypothetical protein